MAKFACSLRCALLAVLAAALASCISSGIADLDGSGVEAFRVSVDASGNRSLTLTIIAPEKSGDYPLIAFSHGSRAAPSRYRTMLDRYAGAGYIVVAPLHRDSELFDGPQSEPETVWRTRQEDFAIAHNPPDSILAKLSERGITVDRSKIVAMGHSYGALVAQVAAGAKLSRNNNTGQHQLPKIRAVVAWSPPGPLPGLIEPEGWSEITVPTFTQTGTADVLPGFIDDWTLHRTAYDMANGPGHRLWVGDGVDHYFGGIYGRQTTTSPENLRLFENAFANSIVFLDASFRRSDPLQVPPSTAGATLERK